MVNLIACLAQHAAREPAAIALTGDGVSLSYGELCREVEATARLIAERCPGTRPVALHLDNGPAWAIFDLALLQLGRTCVPVPSFFTPQQQGHALHQSGAGHVISAAGSHRADVIAGCGVAINPCATPEVSLPDGTAAVARVRQTAPTLDVATRLGTVYADIAPGSAARAGMYARGRFALKESPAVVVPAASVVIRDGRSYVFGLQAFEKAVDRDTVRVVLRPVTVGRRQGSQVEIVQGLAAGGRVAVQGAGFLNDGDAVRIAPTPATAADSADSAKSTDLK